MNGWGRWLLKAKNEDLNVMWRTHLKPSEQKNAMIKFILKGWGINEMQGWEAVYQEF